MMNYGTGDNWKNEEIDECQCKECGSITDLVCEECSKACCENHLHSIGTGKHICEGCEKFNLDGTRKSQKPEKKRQKI